MSQPFQHTGPLKMQLGEDQSDAISSISEGEENADLVRSVNTLSIHESIFMFRETDQTYWIGKTGGWRAKVKVSKDQHDCQHQWQYNDEIPTQFQKCHCCKRVTMKKNRIHCPICFITSCGMCSMNYFDVNVPVAQTEPIQYDPGNLIQEQRKYIQWTEAEINRLKQLVEALKVMHEAQKVALQQQNELLRLENDSLKLELQDLKKGKRVLIEEDEETQKILSAETQLKQPRQTKNMLFNLIVEFEIPDVPRFKVHAILGTGATTCCIDQEAVPKEAIEDNPFVVQFSGINCKTTANKKMKGGKMYIAENSFRIPYTYVFLMKLGDNIQMIIGCNFLRAMQGGVQFEGNSVTFYKPITMINTQTTVPVATAIEELELDEEEYLQISEQVNYTGVEKKGKESMVFNYKGLNDNTNNTNDNSKMPTPPYERFFDK